MPQEKRSSEERKSAKNVFICEGVRGKIGGKKISTREWGLDAGLISSIIGFISTKVAYLILLGKF